MTALNDLNALQASIAEAVLGQDEVIRQIIVGLLANGHLLLESLPGLAKTHRQGVGQAPGGADEPYPVHP